MGQYGGEVPRAADRARLLRVLLARIAAAEPEEGERLTEAGAWFFFSERADPECGPSPGPPPHPFPGFTEPRSDFPVHLAAGWGEDGLRLTLANVGREPFLVHPVPLRCGTTGFASRRVFRSGVVLEVTELTLDFSWITDQVGVPRDFAGNPAILMLS